MKTLSYGISGISIDGINIGSMTKADLVIDPSFSKYHTDIDNFTTVGSIYVNEVVSTVVVELEELKKIGSLYSKLNDTLIPNMSITIAGTNSSVDCKLLPIVNLSIKYNKTGWLSAQFTLVVYGIKLRLLPNNDASNTYNPMFNTQAITTDATDICCYVEHNGIEVSDLTIDIRTIYEPIKRETDHINQIVDFMKLSTDISGTAYIEDTAKSIDCTGFSLFNELPCGRLEIIKPVVAPLGIENKNQLNQIKHTFLGSGLKIWT